MKHRWQFFKEADSSFGVFYPKHYTVAGFDSLEHAQQAEQRFRAEGFAEDDVVAVTGNFVVDELESQRDANLIDRIEASIASAVGTEFGYIEDDEKLARRGGAFLFAYTPDQERIDRAAELLKRTQPVYARRYLPLAIERLMYPPQSAL